MFMDLIYDRTTEEVEEDEYRLVTKGEPREEIAARQ